MCVTIWKVRRKREGVSDAFGFPNDFRLQDRVPVAHNLQTSSSGTSQSMYLSARQFAPCWKWPASETMQFAAAGVAFVIKRREQDTVELTRWNCLFQPKNKTAAGFENRLKFDRRPFSSTNSEMTTVCLGSLGTLLRARRF
jgi:hypothetical protein